MKEAFICKEYKLIYELYFKPKSEVPTLFTQGTLQYIREYVLNHCKDTLTVAQMIELNDLITKEEGKEEEVKRVLSGIEIDDNEVYKVIVTEIQDGDKIEPQTVYDGESSNFLERMCDLIPPSPNGKGKDFLQYE